MLIIMWPHSTESHMITAIYFHLNPSSSKWQRGIGEHQTSDLHAVTLINVFVMSVCSVTSYLSHSIGQDVDNFFMWRGHHTLAVDLDDAVTHPDPTPLSDAPTHKATDLFKGHIQSFR